MKDNKCNHIHVKKGPCVLNYGHEQPHKWEKDIPSGQTTEQIKTSSNERTFGEK